MATPPAKGDLRPVIFCTFQAMHTMMLSYFNFGMVGSPAYTAVAHPFVTCAL